MQLINWLVKPLRRVLPRIFGLDLQFLLLQAVLDLRGGFELIAPDKAACAGGGAPDPALSDPLRRFEPAISGVNPAPLVVILLVLILV